jgi:VWFA-related protein
MRALAFVLVVVTLGLTIDTAGQQAQDPTRVFRSSSRLVQVSVVVRDRRNRPVENLDRSAFQVFEDGREQPIAFFLPSARAEAAQKSSPVAPTTSEPRFTNRITSPTNGGVVAIIFDQLNSSPSQQARARDHLLKYLRSLRPGDRVALYVLGQDRLQVLYDFTSDAEVLVRALDSVTAGATPKLGASDQQIPPALIEGLSAFALANFANMNAAIAELRAEATLENLEHVASHLAGVPGRKNVVWLSAGFPFVIGKATPAGAYNDIQANRTRRATQALNTSDAALYPVDIRGLLVGRGAALPTLSAVHRPIEGLRAAAEWTGGRLFYNTNGLSDAIAQAVDDSRSTYVLGYYPSNPDWNGDFRSIKVTLARKGVEVRHRPGYLAHAPLVAAHDDRAQVMRKALSAPLEATGLPFDVVPDITSERAILRLQVNASDLTLTEADGQLTGEIDVAITQMLKDRRHLPEHSSSYPFNVPIADRERLLATPIQLTRTIQVAPDAAQVRIVIRDARSASIGSIFIDAERLRARPTALLFGRGSLGH